jgi:hypothetical protein
MKSPPVLAWTACALLAAHGIAHAQQTTETANARAPVEITPYVSLGSGNANGAGAAVRWEIAPKLGIELETDVRRAEITAVAIAVSLMYDLPSIGRVVPYAAAGIGFEQYATAFSHPRLGVVPKTGTALTVNAGGGLRIPIDDRWGVRTDARWINGIGREAPEHFRVYSGATFGVGKR